MLYLYLLITLIIIVVIFYISSLPEIVGCLKCLFMGASSGFFATAVSNNELTPLIINTNLVDAFHNIEMQNAISGQWQVDGINYDELHYKALKAQFFYEASHYI